MNNPANVDQRGAVMKLPSVGWCVASVWGLLFPLVATGANVDGDLQRKASWSPSTVEQVRARLDEFLQSLPATEEARQKVSEFWQSTQSEGGADRLLDVTAASLAIVDPRAAELVAACQGDSLDH